MESAGDRITIGSSEVRYERDTGLIYAEMVGDLDGALATGILEGCRAFAEANGPVFVIADARRAGGIAADARKALLESPSVGSTLHVAVFGGSFTVRVVWKLLFKAVAFTDHDFVGTIVDDEAEARAWLRRKRTAWNS